MQLVAKSRPAQLTLGMITMLVTLVGVDLPARGEITIEPSIGAGFKYDSNPRYRPDNSDFGSAWGTRVNLRLPMEFVSQRSNVSLTPRLVYSFYPDDKDTDLEDEDKYLTGSALRMFRRSNLGAAYGVSNLSLRTSEFENAGEETTPGGTGSTGIVNRDAQLRWFIRPQWQYQFSPTYSFRLTSGYEEIRYSEQGASRRFDFDFSYATAALRHIFNEVHSITLQARMSKFDSENAEAKITNESATNSLSVIYTYQWSKTTQLLADIGWARTQNEVQRPNAVDPGLGLFCDPAFIAFFPCEFKSDATNFVGNLTALKRSETVDYRLVVGPSITPNSNGAEVLRFSVNASADKKFTERVGGRLRFLAFTQNDVGNTDRDFERDYVRADVSLNYRFTQNLSISGSYSLTVNQQSDALTMDRKVSNNRVFLAVRYTVDGWRW